jgi:1-acyl-sn-glycerol-3-phosphate acyltransferase
MSAAAPAADPHFIKYPRRLLIRSILRAGIALGFAALADFTVHGRENLPKTGPLLIVGNHFSFLDPVALIHITRYPLEFIGGRRAPNAPGIVSWFRNVWGILPVTRGGSSRDAILRAQKFLDQKGILGIFPEGGSWANVLRPPRPGAALLAARTGAPILPIGFDGLAEVFSNVRRGRRGKVTVNIGRPFGPYDLSARDRSTRQQLEDIGHDIMRHVAELIPPERRGFYSDDPAIRAAAKGTEIYPWEGTQEE